jgi:polyisoprenyl-teichoic acid--peptidoglycan teichoic acid transferase
LPELADRRGLWKRYLIGAFIVIAASAAATAVAAFHQVDRLVNAFHGAPELLPYLATSDPGKPQTILLIGSDKRAAGARDHAAGSRSDTMILMRLDADAGAIRLMSLPRDLKVQIPGHGTDKINASYAYGGTPLLLRTVKRITGLRINHVINVDFRGFKAAVNQIGCVYTDVDRRYFNDNSDPTQQYATINIDPGYQKLCGKNALDYVRYRHTDTDIVRAARQQDFLRQAKSQVGTGKLISKQAKLIKIIGRYTRSDIHGRKAVITLIKLAVGSVGNPIQEIHFPARVGASYVTASSTAVKRATRLFLKGPKKPAKSSTPRRHHSSSRSSHSDLIDISGGGHAQALTLVKGTRNLEIYYPRLGVARSTFSINSPRAYKICRPHHGKCFHSYRIVLPVNGGVLGDYYGLQGTTWKDPPILKSPDEVRTVHGRRLMIYRDGPRVRLVAWQTKDASYWISNTLLQTISASDMVRIARAAKPLS